MDAVQPPVFADLLRRYRRAAGLIREELAERARISARRQRHGARPQPPPAQESFG
jgi:transcriptional regulator with XRE-family HTH domain